MADDEEEIPGEILHRYGEYSPYEMRLFHRRLNDLKTAYQAFKLAKLKDTSKEWPFFMNQSLLITVVYLFLNDLKEFKLLHDAEGGTDNLKRGAYLSRLISNVKPIQFERNYKVQNPDLLTLNEEFAIFVFFLYLRVDESKMDLPVIRTVARDLKFIFTFRDAQRELLVTLARAVVLAVTSSTQNKPSPAE